MSSVAVITGASSGIGRATAEEFAARGFDIAVMARRGELLQELLAELKARHPAGKFTAHPCDLCRWEQVEKTAADVLAAHAHVNVLVNNAGAFEYASLEKISPAKLDEMIDVNVRGVIYTSKAFLGHLKKAASGGHHAKIVNVSSISGLWGFSNLAVYTASKFAVAGFSSALRRELRADGIQVATIYPGPVNTRLPKGTRSGKKMVMVPHQIAAQIYRVATNDRREHVSHPVFKALRWLESVSPEIVDRVLKKIL